MINMIKHNVSINSFSLFIPLVISRARNVHTIRRARRWPVVYLSEYEWKKKSNLIFITVIKIDVRTRAVKDKVPSL